jgi:hypothetical protein
MISEKYREERESSLNKSKEKSYELYRDKSFENFNPVNVSRENNKAYSSKADTSENGYYAKVRDHQNHSFLSRMGETNREAL